jgi:hypothetical protein
LLRPENRHRSSPSSIPGICLSPGSVSPSPRPAQRLGSGSCRVPTSNPVRRRARKLLRSEFSHATERDCCRMAERRGLAVRQGGNVA